MHSIGKGSVRSGCFFNFRSDRARGDFSRRLVNTNAAFTVRCFGDDRKEGGVFFVIRPGFSNDPLRSGARAEMPWALHVALARRESHVGKPPSENTLASN